MSNAEMQACLARLYVDDLFLKLVRADEAEIDRHYDLSQRERAALSEIDFDQLEFFARTLKTKRRRKLAGAYPAVFALEPAMIDRYVLRYFQLYRVHSAGDPLGDVLAFGTYIEECLATAETAPPWAAQVARFETMLNRARGETAEHPETAADAPLSDQSRPRLRPDVLVSDFTYDVVALSEALAAGDPIEGVRREERYGLVVLPARRLGEGRTFRLSGAALMVLDACRGTLTVPQIINQIEDRIGAQGLTPQILQTLGQLGELSLITVEEVADEHAHRPD